MLIFGQQNIRKIEVAVVGKKGYTHGENVKFQICNIHLQSFSLYTSQLAILAVLDIIFTVYMLKHQ